MPLDYDRFDVLTFDCYGTLIDWESGLLAALRRALPTLGGVEDDVLLEVYARYEAEAERPPYRSYRDVLAAGVRGVADDNGVEVADAAVAAFSESVRDWPAFPDSADALERLHERFRLGVITNCDTDLFAASNERLGVRFDWVVTAEMARSYKPGLAGFELAFATIPVPRDRILHVAQSLFHDHVPARQLGLASVWIDRRHDRPGSGATPVADASPDATYSSMRALRRRGQRVVAAPTSRRGIVSDCDPAAGAGPGAARPRVVRSGTSRMSQERAKGTIAIAMPHRKTPWSALEKTWRKSACTSGGSARALAGSIAPTSPSRATTSVGSRDSSPASLDENTAPKRATPNDPPTERKKVAVEVTTPISCGRASFWTMSTSTCITSPSPIPTTSM